jgi:hypothetical protein
MSCINGTTLQSQPCPTAQSSTYAGNGSHLAVDGKTLEAKTSLARTSVESGPWWMVNFQVSREINSVRVYNRLDCCQAQLEGFEIWVGSTPSLSNATKCASNISAPAVFADVSCTAQGQYLFVMLPGAARALQLNEVEVRYLCSTSVKQVPQKTCTQSATLTCAAASRNAARKSVTTWGTTKEECEEIVSYEHLLIQSAYSTTIFENNDAQGIRRHYLAVANFFESSGSNFSRMSPVFLLNTSASKNDYFVLELVRQIPTVGARKLLKLEVEFAPAGNLSFLAVANVFGPSFLYPWIPAARRFYHCDALANRTADCAINQYSCDCSVTCNDTVHCSGHGRCQSSGTSVGCECHANWTGAACNMSVDVSDVAIPTRCASDVAAFTAAGVNYLAFAAFSDPICACGSHVCAGSNDPTAGAGASAQLAVSQIFAVRIGKSWSSGRFVDSVHVSLVQALVGVSWARQVSYFELDGQRFLAFAGEGDESAVVYTSAFAAIRFEKLQTLSTVKATSVSFFTWGGAYLVFAEKQSSSLMFRWDGRIFQGVAGFADETLPQNASGGQLLPSSGAMGAVHIALPADSTSSLEQFGSGDGGLHLMLLGDGKRARLFRGVRERVQGMKRPVALQISPDGQFVYVAAKGSRSIAGTEALSSTD